MTTIGDVRSRITHAESTVSSGELAGVITSAEARSIIDEALHSSEPLTLDQIHTAFTQAGLDALFERIAPRPAGTPDSATAARALLEGGHAAEAGEMYERLALEAAPSDRAALLASAADAYQRGGRAAASADCLLRRADALLATHDPGATAAYREAGERLFAVYSGSAGGATEAERVAAGAGAVRAFCASGDGHVVREDSGSGSARRTSYELQIDGSPPRHLLIEATQGESSSERAALPVLSSHSLAERMRHEATVDRREARTGLSLYELGRSIEASDPAGAAALYRRAAELAPDRSDFAISHDDHTSLGSSGLSDSPSAIIARAEAAEARAAGHPLSASDPRSARVDISDARALASSPPGPLTTGRDGLPIPAEDDPAMRALERARALYAIRPRLEDDALEPVAGDARAAIAERAMAVAQDTSLPLDTRIEYLRALAHACGEQSGMASSVEMQLLQLLGERVEGASTPSPGDLQEISNLATFLGPRLTQPTDRDLVRGIVDEAIARADALDDLPRRATDADRERARGYASLTPELYRARAATYTPPTAREARSAMVSAARAYEHSAELTDDHGERAELLISAGECYGRGEDSTTHSRAAYEHAAREARAGLAELGRLVDSDAVAQLNALLARAESRTGDSDASEVASAASIRARGSYATESWSGEPGITVPPPPEDGRVPTETARDVERQILAEAGITPGMDEASLTRMAEAMRARAGGFGGVSDLCQFAAERYEVLAHMAHLGVRNLTNPPSEANLADYGRALAAEAYAHEPPYTDQEVLEVIGARTRELEHAFAVHHDSARTASHGEYAPGVDSRIGVDDSGRSMVDCQAFAFDMSRHILNGALSAPGRDGRSFADRGYHLASVERCPPEGAGDAHVVAAVFDEHGHAALVMSNDAYYLAGSGDPLDAAFLDVGLPRGLGTQDYRAMFPLGTETPPVIAGYPLIDAVEIGGPAERSPAGS